jgi:nitroreductase
LSVRKFTEKPVEQEKLDAVLHAVQIAPTTKNNQPFRVYVLRSEAAIAKLAALTPCVFGAKMVLLFTYNTKEQWQNPLQAGICSGVEDVSIAATHAMLAAQELGLATCWCNYFPNAEVEKAFALPADEKSVLFMPLGYAAPDAVPAPPHTQKKPLGELVKYL